MKSNQGEIIITHSAQKKILTILIVLAIHISVHAQVDDSTSAFQHNFDNFREGIAKDYDEFRASNDSLFLQFLEQSWKEFEGQPNEMQVRPKPLNQPVFEPIPENEDQKNHKPKELERKDPDSQGQTQEDRDNNDINQPHENLKVNGENDSTSAYMNHMPKPEALDYSRSITFYGSTISLPPFNTSMPLLKGLSKEAVTNFYLQASISDQFKELVAQAKLKAASHRLNDFGYTSLLMKVADFYYIDNNNKTAFLWAALLMSGMNVKLGLNARSACLLVPADVTIYGVSYTIDSKEYYSIGPSTPSAGEKLSIHQADYPGNRNEFTVSIQTAPLFENDPIKVEINNDKTLTLSINKNLMEFYRSYPSCDLIVPMNTLLTESVMKQLDEMLLHLLMGRNDDQRTAMLLRFVQRAFRYATDDEQFGSEKYQFAEEILYYGAGDCEDRSALLAALLQRYTDHAVIGLCYPGHVSLAVNLSTCEFPAIISYEGKPFYHCDPTYLGAECGIAMPSIKGMMPEIIKMKNQETSKL